MRRYMKGILISVLYIGLLFSQLYQLFGNGKVFHYHLHTRQGQSMLLEVVIFSVAALIINTRIKGLIKKLVAAALLLLVAAYLHQTILPLLGSVLYFALIILAGSLGMALSAKQDVLRFGVFCIGSLICGFSVVCMVIGLLSWFQVYSVTNSWIGILIFALIGFWVNRNYIFQNVKKCIGHAASLTADALSLSCIETSVLIQIGRVGLQNDYDALWYGLRSSYVLAHSSKGIFEDLHLVGFTYLYSKGYEIILLPLTKFRSWNYQFLFGALLALTIVIVCYYFVRELTAEKNAWIICAIVASLPCLMNMGMTVKPDVITCLLQLTGILMLYLAYKEGQVACFYTGIVSLLISYGCKMTSLLFTTVIVLGMLPFIRFKKIKINISGLLILFHGILALLIIWGRTFVITGSPLIAYLGRLYDWFGLPVKYPYAISRGINEVAINSVNVIDKIWKGLLGYFIFPATFDHVIIAWGTALPLVLVILATLFAAIRIKKIYIKWIWLMGLLTGSVVFGIAILGQYDGNYFLLFYIMAIVICGSYLMNHIDFLYLGMYAAIYFNIIVSGFTNWTWSYGFTEAKLINKGYIDQQAKQDRKNKKSKVFSTVNENPDNKCIAATDDVYELVRINCITERWHDIATSNAAILADVDSMGEYIGRCGITHIFVNDISTPADSDPERLMCELIRCGYISSIIYGKTRTLLIVGDAAGQNCEQWVEEFEHRRDAQTAVGK